MLHEVRRHADAIVLDDEYVVSSAPVESGLLLDAEAHGAPRGGVLYGIAQQVHEDLAELQGIGDHVLVVHVEGIDEQVQPLGRHLGLYDVHQVVGQLGDVALLLLDLHLSALNPAHVQDIVDQAQEVVAGGEHLLQAVPHLIPVVDMAGRDGGETDDGVHGGAYVVGHIGEEGGLGLVGPLGLHQGILQGEGLLPLLLHLGGDVLGHHHDHDVPRGALPVHDEGLAHAHGLPGLAKAPVIQVDIQLTLLEALPQML